MIFNSHATKVGGYTSKQIGESGAKNIVPFPYYEKAGTESGITWAINDDGTIHAKGKATASVSFTIRATSENWILPKGTYVLSGCPSDGSFNTYRLQLARFINGTLTSYVNEYGTGAVANITDELPLLLQFVVAAGVEIDATIKPMLEVGSVAHGYIPYYFGGAEKAKTAENAVSADTAKNATNATHASSADNASTLNNYSDSDFLKTNGGGTVAFDDYTGFKVKRNTDNDSAGVGVTFTNNKGTCGMIVFKNKKLYRVNASNWGENEVFDTFNKPSGSYTGDGTTTERKIVVAEAGKSIGNVLFIRSEHGHGFVSPSGATFWGIGNTNGFYHFNASVIQYYDGTLTFKETTDTSLFFNGVGSEYRYEQL